MKLSSPPRRRSARRGYSLIELVLVIAIVSVLMTLSAGLFVALSRAERNAVRSISTQRQWGQLQAQFRQDVHRARTVSLASADELRLDQPDQAEIRYVIQADELVRTMTSEAGTHREQYRLPRTAWAFAVTGESPRIVRLIAKRTADTVTQVSPELLPTQEWAIEAALSLTAGNGGTP